MVSYNVRQTSSIASEFSRRRASSYEVGDDGDELSKDKIDHRHPDAGNQGTYDRNCLHRQLHVSAMAKDPLLCVSNKFVVSSR